MPLKGGQPGVFRKNEQYTAASKNFGREISVGSAAPLLATLDGVEIGAYRISIARVLRRNSRILEQSSSQHMTHELLLELRFLKAISPPTVSILKSSGDPELDRKFVEAVSQAASVLQPPAAARNLPYRVELPIWTQPEEH